jgi:hypothetical protein
MKTAGVRILIVIIACSIAPLAFGLQKTQSSKSSEILPLIEKYKAPPYPKDAYLTKETYDYRIRDKRTIPPTLTDTFIADIWQRITLDLKLKIEPENITEDNVKDAIGIYLTKNWVDIAGYRPWTHYNFIKSLKEQQRGQLIREVVSYIRKNGVKDAEKP